MVGLNSVIRAVYPTFRCGGTTNHVDKRTPFVRILLLDCDNPSPTRLQRGAHVPGANLRFRANDPDRNPTEDSR
eukprot:CAMPEP_0183828778 /NCGR_PEP_ID=MMETSP0807_2-20130328/2974_1 /TAXON_ID=88271 /ORGANISM="Picocystis salinarum, Strain CCMP1897" /LENGTH=73 /DNA_ID=CAMNT_0026073983 /DNA_START=173 /DNA_END=390 /DNA_ORIENTATION=+